MGSLTHFSSQNKQKMTEVKQSKIPENVKEYKKEWLYIRGINSECHKLLVKLIGINLHDMPEIFYSPSVKNLIRHLKWVLKYQHNIDKIEFKDFDVCNIDCFMDRLDDITDMYFYPDSFEFAQEAYDYVIDLFSPNYRELKELLNLLYNKLKINYDEEPLMIVWFSSDEEID